MLRVDEEWYSDIDVRLTALHENVPIGHFDLTAGLFRDVLHVQSSLESKKSGLGVSRTLVGAAVGTLERMAAKESRPVCHEAWLSTPIAIERLPRIFADFGYISETRKHRLFYTRTYHV